MNWGTTVLGFLMIGYGIWSGYARARSPEKFAKLEPMKERYGHERGKFLHIVGYTILPIIFGAVFVLAGVKGVAIFGR